MTSQYTWHFEQNYVIFHALLMRFSNFQYIRLLKCKDNHHIYISFIVLIFAGSLGLSLYSVNSLGIEQV